MSAILYGALSRRREQAAADTSTTTNPPGVSTYLDMATALVPAEALALNAYIAGLADTKTTVKNGKSVTHFTEISTLQKMFWLLVLISAVLFILGHVGGALTDLTLGDLIKAAIPAAAFFVWAMLTKGSLFEVVFSNLSDLQRYGYGAFAAVALAALATYFGIQANGSSPPAGGA
jgi:hypothetical protein